MRRRLFSLTFCLLCGTAPVPVPPAGACGAIFLAGQAPQIRNAALTRDSAMLCNDGSAVMTSALTRGAIWSAEHLTSDGVALSRDLDAPPALHPDNRLPGYGRAEEADYRDAEFVATPLAVPEDMTSPDGRAEATAFSNVVPMLPVLRGRLWPVFEALARHLAARQDELYVVTGVAFAGDTVRALHARVLVPSAIWKAAYQPAGGGMAGAWLCRNVSSSDCRIVSIDKLSAEVGIDPFPALPAALRASPRGLPQPGSPLNSGFPSP